VPTYYAAVRLTFDLKIGTLVIFPLRDVHANFGLSAPFFSQVIRTCEEQADEQT